jgi:hypothetical protein
MEHTVLQHRLSLLQHSADLVRLGYHHWVSGSVSAERAGAWARKAERYYGVLLDRNRRARAKRAGDGNAFLLFHERVPGELLWVLLVSDGDHPAHSLEDLRDACTRDGRLSLFDYELVRLTKPGSSRPVYTWRYRLDAFDALRERIVDTVRRGDPRAVHALLSHLSRSAGFHGVRRQVLGQLIPLFRAEWGRRRGTQPCPSFPYLPYVARLRLHSEPLRGWCSRALSSELSNGPQVDRLASKAAAFPATSSLAPGQQISNPAVPIQRNRTNSSADTKVDIYDDYSDHRG